jgi:CRISPR-associated protein Cas2
MPNRNLHIAAYDVREPSRLTAALHLVRSYATGGQKSVHELFLTLAEKLALLNDMDALLRTEDRFLLMQLHRNTTVVTLGQAIEPNDPEFFYLG